MRLTYRTRKRGFTLVEMVVVTPMIILIIGAVVGSAIQMTGSSLRMQGKSQLQLDVLTALDKIEQDVRSSTVINTSSLTSLLLTNLSTNRNPLDSNRKLIRSSDCTAVTGGLQLSEALTHQTAYAVSGGSLQASTSLTNCASNSVVWQKNGNEVIIPNANVTINATYHTHDASITNAVKVTLQATRRIAGKDVSYTGTMYAKSYNIR